MQARPFKGLGAVAVGLSAMLAAPASAQLSTTANGPYYATPTWNQKLTTNRFVILANWNNEAVLDRETGLVWERSPDSTMRTWFVARFDCINRAVGGRKGWRLPTVQELASLIDMTVPDVGAAAPRLPAGHPFLNVTMNLYWSATDFVGSTGPAAWYVYLPNGDASGNPKASTLGTWCVRGGPGPDAQ
jgi:hypothetical protein